jgi:uracil-DNA glycosylase
MNGSVRPWEAALERMGFLPIDGQIAECYGEFLTAERLAELSAVAEAIRKTGKPFFPYGGQVLRFLVRDPRTLRCVIVGMDPYPSHRVVGGETIPEATGRSFEVRSLESWQQRFKQASLRNMARAVYYKETGDAISMDGLREKLAAGQFRMAEPRAWFDGLEAQGVLFLNASLTVEAGVPDSHRRLWDSFVTGLIAFLEEQNPDLRWLLWGDKAQVRVGGLVRRAFRAVHPRMESFVTECPFLAVPDVSWTALE